LIAIVPIFCANYVRCFFALASFWQLEIVHFLSNNAWENHGPDRDYTPLRDAPEFGPIFGI
jgi:hypothetical protein